MALILRDSNIRDSEQALRVALRSDFQVTTVGPGRLLDQAYCVAGRGVEKALGQAAHNLGFGPIATSCRIEKAFGDDARTRQARLDSVYDSFRSGTTAQSECLLRALKEDCQKLLKYALPSQSMATQIQTFRSIILLTTRYPGLRHIFVQSPAIYKAADSPDAICDLWRSTEYDYDVTSRFLLEFAANCLARIDINIELDGTRPSELGCTCEKGLGLIDRLLVGYCSEGGFPRLIAVRYLAGILELPAFWLEKDQLQRYTMDKLCKQSLRLIEDINPDEVSADDLARLALLDPDGVDTLAEAILVGGQNWIQGDRIKGSDSDSWASFFELVKILRGLILPGLLPMASGRAKSMNIMNRVPKSSEGHIYEDTYVSRDGPQDILSDSLRSNLRLSAEESPFSDAEPLLQSTGGESTPDVGGTLVDETSHPADVAGESLNGGAKPSLLPPTKKSQWSSRMGTALRRSSTLLSISRPSTPSPSLDSERSLRRETPTEAG